MSEKTTVIKEINSLNKQIGQAIKSGADATVDRLEKKLDKRAAFNIGIQRVKPARERRRD